MKHIKLILLFLLIIPLFILSLVLKVNAHDKHRHEDDIVINVSGSVDLGDVIRGTTKSNFINEPVIRFEIQCKNNRNIRIIKYENNQNSGITYETEWKQGPASGFEYPFSNSVYITENMKFYITVRIKSVYVSSNAKAGIHNFSPSVFVEICDI